MTTRAQALNPYLGGLLTGVLLVLTVWISGQFFGASTSFPRAAALFENCLFPGHVAGNAYFQKVPPKIDWQMMFLGGLFLGALFSAKLSKSFSWQAVPDLWKNRFGPGVPKRAFFAVLGGFIAILGARLADGCPSGHGLSGMSQLSLSSLISLIFFFAGGIAAARFLYKRGVS